MFAPNPFLLMSVLFMLLAALAAVDTAATSLGLTTAFNGLRWIRVHLITLGILAETVFGLAPMMIAVRSGLPRPGARWDIWLALNGGLVMLFVGIPLVNGVLIAVGGALILGATVLLLGQIRAIGICPTAGGRVLYLLGLTFLLVGVTIGTGLWIGWAEPLRIAVPLETHIHANVFGFLAMTMAGLLIDIVPVFTGRRSPESLRVGPMAWLMGCGATLLVIAPWTGIMQLNLVGILLHLSGTIWVLLTVVTMVRGAADGWTAGSLHLVTGYVWFLAPLFVAPLVITGVVGEGAEAIEQSAPQALIFGWAAQISYALGPGLLRWLLLPGEKPRLGGSYVTLIAAHLGGVSIWASILTAPLRAPLYALAYTFWGIALLMILAEAWGILARAGREGREAVLA
ncbi:MAG: hypothetical protein U0821_02695 [Chloroflexota bacterium]